MRKSGTGAGRLPSRWAAQVAGTARAD